jgi:hypothetical protein
MKRTSLAVQGLIAAVVSIALPEIRTTHLTAGSPHPSEKAIPVIRQRGLPPPAVLKSEWPTPRALVSTGPRHGLPGGTNDTVARRPFRLSPAPPGDLEIAPLPDY